MSDKHIIKLVLSGDTEQYQLLVERYHQRLIYHLSFLLKDDEQAKDIAQEAFIQAFSKLSQYNDNYAFSTWLYRIADNFAYKQIKQSKRIERDFDIEILEDDKPEYGDVLDRRQTREQVRESIKSLEPRYQQVITLYYWENFNYEQIAEVIDHPVGTVRTWLFRAKEQLRKELYGQVRQTN